MPTYYNGSTSTGDTTWQSWTQVDNGTSADQTWVAWTSSGNTTGTFNIDNSRTSTNPRLIDAYYSNDFGRRIHGKFEPAIDAKNRAKELLLEFMTTEQAESLERMSQIVVKSQLGNLYRIKEGRARNIEELDENGNVIAILCAHPIANVPDYDTMLVQALMLQYNEAEFRRIANIAEVH